MGTVGLAFGSATSGTGFDVSTTVTSILALQQAIETPWKTQLSTLQSQDTAFSTLGTDLSSLSTKLQALTDFAGVTAEKVGASSNTDVLSLSSATAQAIAGTHQVTVTQLAQTSSAYSSAVKSTDALSGSITLQVGSGTAQTIAVPSDTNTLQGLMAAINSAGMGVSASLVTDGSGQRLSLISGTGGTAGQLSVTSSLTDTTTGLAVTAQAGLQGEDAQFTVDGVALTSGSNTISTAIPGVTFQLVGASSQTVQVQIGNDTTDISSAMNDFVTAYNQLVTDMTTQEGKDSSGNAEPLYGSSTLALMQTQLSQALNAGAASGSINNLSQLGITVNQDGSLTYSSSDMLQSLNTSFNDVIGFLQNTGSFGQNLTTVLNGLSSTSTTGALYLAMQQNTTEETALNKNVSDEEDRLALEKTSLTSELNTANEILQSIPQQLEEIDKIYSAVTGYNSTT